jgi:hypothetical protein
MSTLDPCFYNNKWKDARCFVIGGGPSIQHILKEKFSFNKLINERVVTTNQSFKLAPWGYIASADPGFWGRNSTVLPKDENCRIFYPHDYKCFGAEGDPRAVFIHRRSTSEIPTSFADPFPLSLNSGAFGILTAYLLGCKTLYLVGMDATTCDGKSHYHNDYNIQLNQSQSEGLQRSQRIVIRTLLERGVKVFSCSSISVLNDELPYLDIRKLTF